ncbi:protein of unknown function (DUF928) [Cylindrospermum stagnale PCC 7417]|uniref:DUF928 domain-containing protein n=1 Tax=Cylindrospermum stagnale PCC 7417 TaxID=56107 RepID=K9X3J9_9NOST|nr:DUF928 domain-containing protein [Cylindrospermum stagnale]AFZ26621.1 protein of unknown function (DUF928) [Cylindrospermum stagnale PCC 7417]
MKLIKTNLCFLAFSLPLFSQAAQVQAQSVPTTKTWQISQAFKPPQREAPPASAGGASRGTSCVKGNKAFTPLIPANKLGLTFSERPTFFWYVPPSPVKTAQLLVLDDSGKNVFYETSLTLPDKTGIISYTLPDNTPALEVGKTYRWYLTLVCDDQDSSSNPRVDGWVKRTQPELTLSEALLKSNLQQLPTLYADAGIWHEALTSLVQLRRTGTNKLKTTLNWRQFLNSVGLNAIASEPLIDCCTAKNNQ